MSSRLSDNDGLLDPLEAAYLLGITPELLFAYVRFAPKTRMEPLRRLKAVQDSGRTMFMRADLLEFDAYLRQPWSNSGDDRPSLPNYVVEYLKVECGGQCARCGKGYKLENAHIEDYSRSLSHHHHNLIRLCSHCHDEFDSKRILCEGEIASIKERLIVGIRERLTKQAYVDGKSVSSTPSPSSVFFGRDIEVKALIKALGEHRTLCIRGTGGIGKTQLLLNALRQCDQQRPVLWIEVELFGSVSELDLGLRAALASMNHSDSSCPIEYLLDRTNGYVVFDGVEAITEAYLEQLEDFFSALIARTKSTIFVFTSQADLLSVEIEMTLELGPLDKAASLDVIHSSAYPLQMDSVDERAATTWLLNFCDGHPLTIKVVAGLLRYFGSASIVAERIRKFGTLTLQNPMRKIQTRATSLNISLATAYSALQPDERRVLFIAAHCPAGFFPGMIGSGSDYGVQDVQDAIAILRRWHLLSFADEQAVGKRLRVLSPIRIFIQSTYEHEEAASAEEVFFSLIRDLAIQAAVLDEKYIVAGDVAYGMVRFGQEFPNFTHIFDEAVRRADKQPKYLDYIGSLASSLQVFCFVSGLSRRGIEIMRAGANAAVCLGKIGAATELLLQLIVLGRREGDSLLVSNTVKEIVELSSGTADPRVRGHTAMAEGQLALADQRMDDALGYFQIAAECFSRDQCQPGKTDQGDNADEYENEGLLTCTDERMLALALMEQGFVYEHSDQPSEALDIYRKSLSLMKKTKDEVNYGSVLHQIGNCNAHLNHNDQAYEAYLGAARRFLDIGAAEHLSNSLSELGYLLIDYDPDEQLDVDVPATLIEAGLYDVTWQATRCFSAQLRPLPAQQCIGIVQKIFGVAILGSFTKHNVLLLEFADSLREKIVRPLALQLDEGVRSKVDDGIAVMYLDITSALIGCISDLERETRGPPSLAEIEHLARLCYMQYDWAWKAFRLFDWLATYLGRYHHVMNITASTLQDAAYNCEELNRPFSLPGFKEQLSL